MKKLAYIVLKTGNYIPMTPSLEEGCEVTRVFNSRGKREVENNGLMICIGDNASEEAIESAIHLLVKLKKS